MIQRIEINQRIELREQITNRDADGFAVIGEQHHQIDEALVFNFPFDQRAQNSAVDSVEKFTNIKFQRVAVIRCRL